jgi:hypothetical protein
MPNVALSQPQNKALLVNALILKELELKEPKLV